MISTEAVRLGYSNVPQTSSLKGNALRNENLFRYKIQQHQNAECIISNSLCLCQIIMLK